MSKSLLKELNDTRKRIASHMPIPANHLLTRYDRLCEQQQEEIDTLKQELEIYKEIADSCNCDQYES
jgi:hypothetical protein